VETAQPAYQENHCLVTKNTFEAAYRDALQRARQSLLARDIAACCAGGGADFYKRDENAETIALCFLNRPVRITLPDFSFTVNTNDTAVPIWEQIVALHYLANSERAALSDTLVNYRRLRDGTLYAEAFEKRCIQPLLNIFGPAPDTLIPAAQPLGGVAADFADCAVRIPAFPKLDIICCLWKSDAEFGPEATILFDSGIEQFLCVEDIAVLCQQIVLQLIKNRVS